MAMTWFRNITSSSGLLRELCCEPHLNDYHDLLRTVLLTSSKQLQSDHHQRRTIALRTALHYYTPQTTSLILLPSIYIPATTPADYSLAFIYPTAVSRPCIPLSYGTICSAWISFAHFPLRYLNPVWISLPVRYIIYYF